jgi:hypothetical protein
VREQPFHEFDDVSVTPHPGRKAPEVGERRHRVGVGAHAAHVAVDAVGIGPIGLDRDGGEAPLRDEPPRDQGALAIELVRAV